MKRLFVAAALSALAIGQAHAQAGGDDLARGRELRISGRAVEAVPLLELASRAKPNDADIWLNLGLAYAATNRLDDADRALGQAQALAPTYADVLIARARVAFFRGDLAEAERRLSAAPASGDVEALRTQIAAARVDLARWRMDASVSRGQLSGGLPRAAGGTIALTRRVSPSGAVTGSAEYVRQFGREDVYFEAQRAWRFAYLAAGAAPDADFRPEVAVRGGLTAPAVALSTGWAAEFGLDASWARYPVGDVRSLHPYAALTNGERLRLQARWINVVDERDEHRSGYAVSLAWRPAARIGLSLGWADAPESSQGVTTQAEALSGGVSFDVDASTTLRLGVAHERRPVYGRTDLSVGIGRRF